MQFYFNFVQIVPTMTRMLAFKYLEISETLGIGLDIQGLVFSGLGRLGLKTETDLSGPQSWS